LDSLKTHFAASGTRQVWYKVIGTGIGIRASTCGVGTTFDTRISIYRGASCDELECVMSDDNGCGFQSSAYWFSREGETYYILVTGNLFSSFGDFVLRVEDYRPNTINDFCANAISASTTTVNLGSTKNATFDGVETCVVSNTAPGMSFMILAYWWRFTLACFFNTWDFCLSFRVSSQAFGTRYVKVAPLIFALVSVTF
jgi:hypothetical protein